MQLSRTLALVAAIAISAAPALAYPEGNAVSRAGAYPKHGDKSGNVYLDYSGNSVLDVLLGRDRWVESTRNAGVIPLRRLSPSTPSTSPKASVWK